MYRPAPERGRSGDKEKRRAVCGTTSSLSPPLRFSHSSSAGSHEFKRRDRGNESGGGAAGQERCDRLAAAGAVVEGPVVDVHADEFIGEVAVEIAAELEGVFDGRLAMIEAVLDGGSEDVGDILADGFAEVFADAVSAEG